MTASSRTCISPRSPAAPTSSPASCSAFRPMPVCAARSRGRASAWRSTSGTRRPADARREGRARLHQGLPVDADRLLERSRRREIPRRLFRALRQVWCHGDFAEWTEHGGIDHPRPLRRDAEPAAACASARPRSTTRSSRCRRSPRRCASARTATATCASCCSCGSPTGVALDDDLETAHPRQDPHRRQPAPRAGQGSSAVADIPRTKSGKIAELAVRDVVHGRPVKNNEALANPEALELFRDLPTAENIDTVGYG